MAFLRVETSSHGYLVLRGVGLATAFLLAACNNSKLPSKVPEHINNETKFSSKEFGVDGSPRVTTRKSVRKGGGSYKIGKPYTIRGITYYPKEDPTYNKTGHASWYGPNFHGRLTANGEIYDQFSLSAAHPTMPLPSYAKVTNLENGSSVTVRVNDRGPYAHNRIIDLSARAAELLGYTKQGVAKVRVEYVGKARMDGLDESYLVASYDPGNLNPATIPNAPQTQVIVADVKNGRVPLASINTSSTQASYVSQRVPLPEFRPMTNRGIPLEIADTPTTRPRPVAGLSGYFDDRLNQQFESDVFSRFDLEPGARAASGSLKAPENGMGDLVRLKFGPFRSEQETGAAEDVLVRFGPVHQVSLDNGKGNALVLTAAREELSEFMRLPEVARIPALK